jgi:hypothetical protein
MSDSRRGFGLDIGFIDHLQIITTNNYNIIANFHTLPVTDIKSSPHCLTYN